MIFKHKERNLTEHTEELQIPLFGYELLREEVLPDLLGKDHNVILYWAGKSLARKYPLSSIDELIAFFDKAGWGNLVLVKEKKTEAMFELTSFLFDQKKSFSAPLEAGFIAEQIQNIQGFITEANEVSKIGKLKKVVFHVKWDLEDRVTT
ncbi:hypothetical protein BKP45_12135 [Anaerobacillus alkalidiazotrophicus]|uniref:DUF2507 domain-containing protein n=1 Tax=Anaerobacillus alkalidiazotrophicus TaxID=472963 RepID=A0A1S2M4X7_9BACI|nr:YslB family protein [Anaerobacillus alkalidiazotrophicus]OIJ18319.1 hypothetical protein BKP45_17850 [Anaerobacillus alkalidiazotrophicus]OIJ19798.1 hypothetical protein BKP45_12135 [Anaerobacillus alkalidiazotrophicus]